MVGWKKNGRIPVSGKNYDGIPGGERKNTGKFQGAVKVLMEFQGCTVSENGYPQQGVRTISGKSHYMKNFTFFLFVVPCHIHMVACMRRGYGKLRYLNWHKILIEK